MAGTASFNDLGYPLLQSDYIDNIIDLLSISEDGSTPEPKDLRDSNWTLWNKIEDVQISASQSYDRTVPTLISVGGISIGSTFSGLISDVLDRMLYPYVIQSNSLTASNSYREYGSSLDVELSWTVTKGSSDIEEIIISNNSIIVTGETQFGVETISSTHSLTPGLIEVNTFTMSSYDGVSNIVKSATINWMSSVYWGTISLSSVGNPDLLLDSSSLTDVSDYIDDSIINSLVGSKLSSTMSSTYMISANNQYLCFVWPSQFGEPTFNVNGMNNNAFTKVKSEYAFTNGYGFNGVDYDVWLSNVQYNSSVEVIIK